MRLYQLVLCIFFLGAACINAHAQEEAPLGLLWGNSSSDLRTRGVELAEYSKSEFGKGFLANKFEKAIADQDKVLLSFGFNDKLWRITILSREFPNDPFGSAVQRIGKCSVGKIWQANAIPSPRRIPVLRAAIFFVWNRGWEISLVFKFRNAQSVRPVGYNG
jgi:hypothetical protein